MYYFSLSINPFAPTVGTQNSTFDQNFNFNLRRDPQKNFL